MYHEVESPIQVRKEYSLKRKALAHWFYTIVLFPYFSIIRKEQETYFTDAIAQV